MDDRSVMPRGNDYAVNWLRQAIARLRMSWIAKSTLNWWHSLVIRILKAGHVPEHVAIIMDGNRRYASKNGMEKVEGHSKGFDKLAEVLQWCLEFGIREVTVYAFSIENFKRNKEEVDNLMELAREKFKRLLDEETKLKEHGVCIRVIGNLSFVPEDVRALMAKAMQITKDNDNTVLNVAFSYTSKEEISTAIKDITEGVKNCEISEDDINEDLVTKCLYTHKSKDPDLLIRTSGEVRFSDFLMWQTSFTCIYFSKSLWPEFSEWDFISAVFYYQRCYNDIVKIKNDCKTEVPVSSDRTIKFVDKLHKRRESLLKYSIKDDELQSSS